MQQKWNILHFSQAQISCLIKYDSIVRLPSLGHMEETLHGSKGNPKSKWMMENPHKSIHNYG